MRRYAEDTTVPIAKSRQEINELLRTWGGAGVSWGESFESGDVELKFGWRRGGVNGVGGMMFKARLCVKLEPMEKLREAAKDQRRYDHPICEGKLAKLIESRGRREHRLLLLWLKAAFNAVDAGLVSAEEVFLPFLEGPDGRTVGEMAIPQLERLFSESADHLLPEHTP